MGTRSRRLDAQKVIDLRGANNLTQGGLARRAGLSKETVGNVECGKPVSRATLGALARVFKCDPNELLLKESPDSVPEAIARYLISFDSLIEDRTRDFTGRGFVFEEIDRFLDDPNVPSGYLVMRGDPGIGKSAIIAELVRRRRLPVYHFNIGLQGINTAGKFLGNVCARLITRFQLPYAKLPPDFDEDGTVLNRMLHLAAGRLEGSDQLVIAVDALDEVESAAGDSGADPLFLPFDLPTGVYFVMTARLKDKVAVQGGRVREWILESRSDDNETDIRAFVQDHLVRDGIRRWMERGDLTEARFVDLMWERSQGNFMYLRHVLPAMERGRFFKGGPRELPLGLRAYYQTHWAQMRSAEPAAFERLYMPVVCVLGAAQEAVPPEMVVEWTQLELHEVTRVLSEWREFLQTEPGPDGSLNYRIYHTAFREFLQEEVDPGLKRYHKMILAACKRKLEGLLDGDG